MFIRRLWPFPWIMGDFMMGIGRQMVSVFTRTNQVFRPMRHVRCIRWQGIRFRENGATLPRFFHLHVQTKSTGPIPHSMEGMVASFRDLVSSSHVLFWIGYPISSTRSRRTLLLCLLERKLRNLREFAIWAEQQADHPLEGAGWWKIGIMMLL